MSFREAAQPFQNASNARKNPAQGVSNHGSSSRNTTFFFSVDASSKSSNRENAAIQDVSRGHFGNPCRLNSSRNNSSCSRFVPLSIPVARKANCPLKASVTRYVLPTRLRPYKATNSDCSEFNARNSSFCSVMRQIMKTPWLSPIL